MKKAVSLILALIMAFSFCSMIAFAEGEDTDYGEVTTEPVTEPITEPAADEPIAVLYLCSYALPYSRYIFGHTWICIKNISDNVIYIGTEGILPGKMISVGLHSFEGVGFNEEMGDFGGCSVMALSAELTQSKFNDVCNEILKSKWGWYELFTHNCTNFAVAVWKAGTGNSKFAFCFPFIVSLQMLGADRIKIS